MDTRYLFEDCSRWGNKIGTNNLAEILNAKLAAVLGEHPTLTDWITGIQKQMALTIARWKQLNEHGKTNWRSNKERKKDLALQQLAKQLEQKQITVQDYLTKCSKAMNFHFNSIEADLDVDLDEMVQLSVQNNLAV